MYMCIIVFLIFRNYQNPHTDSTLARCISLKVANFARLRLIYGPHCGIHMVVLRWSKQRGCDPFSEFDNKQGLNNFQCN